MIALVLETMDLSDKAELERAISFISSRLGLPDYSSLLDEYLYGERGDLIDYEKLRDGDRGDVPAIVKYLICGHS